MTGHVSFTDFIEQRTFPEWTGRFFQVYRVNYRNSLHVSMRQWFLVCRMCEVRLYSLKAQLLSVILMTLFQVERVGYGLDGQGVWGSVPDKGSRFVLPA
jgi:hypothetical protein